MEWKKTANRRRSLHQECEKERGTFGGSTEAKRHITARGNRAATRDAWCQKRTEKSFAMQGKVKKTAREKKPSIEHQWGKTGNKKDGKVFDLKKQVCGGQI